MAYLINTVSKELGAAQYIIQITESWMSASMLPFLTFIICVLAGGGVFGDHCSPLSDTTILSSFGAASDHIDHLKTQLPYASVAAATALVIYLVIGIL